MLKLAVVLMTLAIPLAAQEAAPPVAPPAPAPQSALTTTKISASAMASDPRMLAAIRHANAAADVKCGAGVGAIVDLATKATAQRCRRRMIDAAKADAEFDIAGN